jgi:hypothetical protein
LAQTSITGNVELAYIMIKFGNLWSKPNWPLIRGESISILKVKVVIMNELIRDMNVNFIDLILIDAEGQEIKILENQKQLFLKARIIIVDTEPSTVSKLSDILTNNGYVIRFLDGYVEHGGNLLAEKFI